MKISIKPLLENNLYIQIIELIFKELERGLRVFYF